MVTKTTLKALWVAGGGVLATWLAVTPNQGVPTAAPQPQRPQATNGPSAEMLNAQADKLRVRTTTVTLRPSTRNPFRFSDPKVSPAPRGESSLAPSDIPVPAAPPPPPLTLAGIAESKVPEGPQRTAVITAAGQIYLVKVGDSVAGLFTVSAIEPEAVVLTDAIGGQMRLVLR